MMKRIGYRMFAALLCACVLPAGSWAAEAATRDYDWLTAGEVSGFHRLQVGTDGSRVVEFEFNDRGRGPKIREVSRVDVSGLPLSIRISGHSYMGAPADESFRVEDGIARWSSTLEQGEAKAGAFYWAHDGTFEQLAMLARALLDRPDRRLGLLPAGQAAISQLARHEDATLFAISGLGLTPDYVWLDPNRELFAVTMGWMSLVASGHADMLPQLQAVQDRAEAEHHRKLAADLTHELPANWLINNVSVVDVESGALLPNRLVAVRDGRIVRVVEDKQLDLPVYGDLQPKIIDGQGMLLMPGLWDMHTHLSMADGLLNIAAGVTTVRDLANDPERLREVREAFDSGVVIGPRTFAAGFIDKKSPYSAPTGKRAENLDEALQMVSEYADAGYPQIKIYSSIDPAWVKPLAAAIHARDMRLSGHIPSFMTARQAVLDGFDEIQHINMLFLNFLAGPEDDTRTPLRFSLVAEKAAGVDLDAPEVRDFITLLRDSGVVVDPTVTIFDSMFRHRSGELDPSYAMIADHMPPAVRRSMLAGKMDITDDNAALYARSADALLEMIARLYRGGVPLVAGTDAMAGFTLHRELELYQRAGIAAAKVLRLATLESAHVAGVADQAGSIAVGKQADFVLLARNPLENISAVRRPLAVFKGDRWYDTAQLYEAIGIQPFTR